MYQRFGKRALDIAAALVGLVALSIPMAVIGVLIGATSGRPILFCQARVGRHGRLFTIRKFRTMVLVHDIAHTITTAGDPRVTRIGRFLRRWKLDELPQLWNVLVGDMSLVGPRPDVPGYADTLEGEARKLLSLRPGITGPASLAFREEEALLASVADPLAFNDNVVFPAKVRLNLQYLEECSFRADLRYILQTLGVLRGPMPADLIPLGQNDGGLTAAGGPCPERR